MLSDHSLSSPFWIRLRILLPPAVHLFGDISGLIVFPESVLSHYAVHGWFWVWLKDFLVITAGLYVVSEGNVFIYRRLERKIPWEVHPARRLLRQLLYGVGWTLLTGGLLALVMSNPDIGPLWRDTAIGMLILAAGVSIVLFGVFVYQRMKRSVQETERLRIESVRASEALLRQQMDPHFLFNSLNALAGLIGKNPAQAEEYVLRLSRMYRSLLEWRERALIPLRDELAIARDAIALYTLRFGASFTATIDVPEAWLDTLIPPLTLQILIENCVSHNVVLSDKPLHLRIGTNGNDRIVVSNNLQRKVSRSSGTGLGLRNLVERYSHATAGIVDIRETEDSFIVSLPRIHR